MVELLLVSDWWSERIKKQIKANILGTDKCHRKSINIPSACQATYA